MTPPNLSAEWRRIELLARCALAGRQGQSVGDDIRQQLAQSQAEVTRLRAGTAGEPAWAGAGLSSLDIDLLMAVAAPDADPRLGRLYLSLQPEYNLPYPTPSLVCELLFLAPEEGRVLHARLATDAPLRRCRWVESASFEPWVPMRLTASARRALFGWTHSEQCNLPGAHPLRNDVGWNDLVLGANALSALRNFSLWMRWRDQVERDWGARTSGGPVALFHGPSGTGKSFAAQVLAADLDLTLQRVDLGLLVSKYVGETEKNLNALFDAAEGASVLLLFDEADSLFGRRGEVRDARDRYANMEVSHLLSRIERHRGPCILTTNLRQHLDTAFTRRFHVVVGFARPDVASRTRLWQLHLPPHAPLEPDVSCDLLARSVDLTGGQIRNAATQAAVLAASEGRPIGLPHLASAVWCELAKGGQEFSAADLGLLACWLGGVGELAA